MMMCCPATTSSGGLTAVATVDIEAPAELVWEVISDLDSAPSILSSVVSVKRDTNSPQFSVGTKWSETREYDGEQFLVHKTITSMSVANEDDNSYTVQIHVSFRDLDPKYQHITNTSTLTVTPLLHDNGDNSSACSLIGTFALVSEGYFRRLWEACFSRHKLKSARKDFQCEMEDYAEAALKRQEQVTQTQAQSGNEEN